MRPPFREAFPHISYFAINSNVLPAIFNLAIVSSLKKINKILKNPDISLSLFSSRYLPYPFSSFYSQDSLECLHSLYLLAHLLFTPQPTAIWHFPLSYQELFGMSPINSFMQNPLNTFGFYLISCVAHKYSKWDCLLSTYFQK